VPATDQASPSTPTAPVPEWQYQREFHLVTQEGWEYDVQLAWDFDASFGKDISTSPPGLALWTANVTANSQVTYQGTLAGRTAPDMELRSVPGEFDFSDRRLESAGPCGMQSSMLGLADVGATYPDDTVLTCDFESGNWISREENQEGHIDEALAALNGQSPPAFVALLRWNDHTGIGCAVVLPADPTVPVYEGGPTGPGPECDIVSGSTSVTPDSESDSAPTASETQPVVVTGSPLPTYDSAVQPDTAIGLLAPSATGKNFAGQDVALNSTAGPYLAVFVTHWCPHCHGELPRLVTWDSGLEPPVRVIGISTAVDPTAAKYPPSEWFAAEGWPWAVRSGRDDRFRVRRVGLPRIRARRC